MENETIYTESPVGKRLDKIIRGEKRALLFNNKKIPLVSKITIGRDSSNTVVIENKMASRNHALIQKIKNDYYVKDENSTNGTFVNGKKIPEDKYIKIQRGDVITIGKSELIMA